MSIFKFFRKILGRSDLGSGASYREALNLMNRKIQKIILKMTLHVICDLIIDLLRDSIQGPLSQSVHIHCRHTILAHLFFRDFLPYSHTLLIFLSLSLSLTPPSLSLFLSLSLSLTVPSFSHPLTPPSISLSHTLLISLSLSLSFPFLFLFFSPFSFFPFKTIQPL